jgi:hypothetical protein
MNDLSMKFNACNCPVLVKDVSWTHVIILLFLQIVVCFALNLCCAESESGNKYSLNPFS